MGYTSWSNDFYADREAERKRSGKSAFAYHEVVQRAPASEQKCHPEMNPHGITRESRDSDEHPESIAIAVIMDQTGSMASTPVIMQKALPKLMTNLTEGGVTDPQVLFGCVGDETNRERASLQIGQFESGIEMDDDLGKMFMEGKGGGSFEESYQNALYFFAKHTSCDCIEKRGVKGKLFIIGDEMPYPVVKKTEVKKLMGDDIQDDIPVEEIILECQEKWDIYFVVPQGTFHANDSRLFEKWEGLLGADHVIRLPDASHICEGIVDAVLGAPAGAPNIREAANVRL